MLSNFVSVFLSREVQEWTLLDPSLLWKYPLNNIFNVQNIQHFSTNIFQQNLQQRYQSKFESMSKSVLRLFLCRQACSSHNSMYLIVKSDMKNKKWDGDTVYFCVCLQSLCTRWLLASQVLSYCSPHTLRDIHSILSPSLTFQKAI